LLDDKKKKNGCAWIHCRMCRAIGQKEVTDSAVLTRELTSKEGSKESNSMCSMWNSVAG